MSMHTTRPAGPAVLSVTAIVVGVLGIVGGGGLLALLLYASRMIGIPTIYTVAATAICVVSIMQLIFGLLARYPDHNAWVLGIVTQIAAGVAFALYPASAILSVGSFSGPEGLLFTAGMLYAVLCFAYLVSPAGRSRFAEG